MKKKKYLIIASIIVLMAAVGGGIYYYLTTPFNKIKNYYNVIDIERNVDKYNKLVVESKKIKDFTTIPDNVVSRKILEVKNIDYNNYPILKEEINSKYLDKKENIRYYMVKYDINFKEGVPTVVDPGIYYIVMTMEKEDGKWLINPGIHKASFIDNKLIIES